MIEDEVTRRLLDEREAQGFPPKVTDQSTIEALARLLVEALNNQGSEDPRQDTLP